MWNNLPKDERDEYKLLILSMASLSELFAQKADESEHIVAPIINTKYQETVFQHAFKASGEDIGNTSFDASLQYNDTKYLVGIKTFGIKSGFQKIAQFKRNREKIAKIVSEIDKNKNDVNGKPYTAEELLRINESRYIQIATIISTLRNQRISSSKSNLQGFIISETDEHIESVYHVLMPSGKNESPEIHVGEIAYNEIDIEKIKITGCTGPKNPANFTFSDGNHEYRFTPADCQLYMDFKNEKIILDSWNVIYNRNPYDQIKQIGIATYNSIPKTTVVDDSFTSYIDSLKLSTPTEIPTVIHPEICESYSWRLTNNDGNMEMFSGLNGFYGVGSKLSTSSRLHRINQIKDKYTGKIDNMILSDIITFLKQFLLTTSATREEKIEKVQLRNKIINTVKTTKNPFLFDDVQHLVFRPKDEMYIPIPNSKEFHQKHPNFFGPNIGTFKNGTSKLALSKPNCKFNLVFEPSQDSIPAFITQDNGKAIESYEKQSHLGNWILRGLFQLPEYEPLTAERLNDININGIRLYKTSNSEDVHLAFIWIEPGEEPDDLWY